MEALKNNVNFSKFDLSHTHKTSMDMGQIVPIACIPTLPGDKVNVDVDAFIRGMPTIAPIMDKVDIKINHFYVPYRVLWSRFEEFISHSDKHKLRGDEKPTIPVFDAYNLSLSYKDKLKKLKAMPESAKFKYFPLMETYSAKYQLGKLANYLGLDTQIMPDKENDTTHKDLISLMPILAYNRIFLDYYAPQRWVNYFTQNNTSHWFMKLSKLMETIKNSNNYKLTGSTGGTNTGDLMDFFGLSGVGYGFNDFEDDITALLSIKNVYWNQDYFSSALPEPTLFGDVKLPLFTEDTPDNKKHLIVSGGSHMEFANSGNFANASDIKHNNTVLSTIRDLRKSISLQHYFETLSQSGGRYLETMEVMFGKRLPDDMLSYSEYLGGSVIPLFVNEVEQTAPAVVGNKQTYLGDLSGKPVAAGDTENVFFEADEYGVYMCMAHIVPKRSYARHFNRAWRELDALDLPNPAFEGLGDQAVYMYELGNSTKSIANNIFGYVPRYAHYKTVLDRYSGEMEHTLRQWHLGDGDKATIASANNGISPRTFLCKPRNDIFHVPDEPDKFICTYNIKIDAVRPLAYEAPVGVSRI
jgi:capsid protein (F protein)